MSVLVIAIINVYLDLCIVNKTCDQSMLTSSLIVYFSLFSFLDTPPCCRSRPWHILSSWSSLTMAGSCVPRPSCRGCMRATTSSSSAFRCWSILSTPGKGVYYYMSCLEKSIAVFIALQWYWLTDIFVDVVPIVVGNVPISSCIHWGTQRHHCCSSGRTKKVTPTLNRRLTGGSVQVNCILLFRTIASV